MTQLVSTVLDKQLAIQKKKFKLDMKMGDQGQNSAEAILLKKTIEELKKEYYLGSLKARNMWVDIWKKMDEEHPDTALFTDLQYNQLLRRLMDLICSVKQEQVFSYAEDAEEEKKQEGQVENQQEEQKQVAHDQNDSMV